MLIAGVDDAGKGPLLGPMILAGVMVNERDMAKLRVLGVKDSKLLSASQRDLLYDLIINVVKNYKVVIVSPKEIDKAVESENSNLNWLESVKFAEIINALKPGRVMVDCPSPNIEAYTEHLRKHLKVKTHLQCEHHAESKSEAVAAASILAKVTRDREVAKLRKKYGEFGSGYPADPKTKKFLEKNWKKYPELFRRSWASYKRFAGDRKQKTLLDY